MKLFSASVILAALAVVGCGGGDTGPASPADTPVMTEEQKKEAMTKNVPPAAQKMYEQYQKGGTYRP